MYASPLQQPLASQFLLLAVCTQQVVVACGQQSKPSTQPHQMSPCVAACAWSHSPATTFARVCVNSWLISQIPASLCCQPNPRTQQLPTVAACAG